MLTGRKLWELTKCPCLYCLKSKYGNAHYLYIQSRARCDKPFYMGERRLFGVEKHHSFQKLVFVLIALKQYFNYFELKSGT